MADEDLTDSISENAAQPRRVTGDAGSVESHPLPDQIAADRYLAAKRATKKGTWPLRFVKMNPPSPSGVDRDCY